MRRVRVQTRDGAAICIAEVAESHWTRFRGLLGRNELLEGEGLWIRPCSSVHTFFMHFPIDVVYLTNANVVAKTCSRLPPSRLSFGGRGAYTVLELPPGAVEQARLTISQQLLIEPVQQDERGPHSDTANG